MCGIFAYVGTKKPVDLLAITATLRHRGPDGEGVFEGDGCTLVHTRLSIIDLSDRGHQPMTDATGRYVVVFNGEIYNYRTVLADLARERVVVETDSDTAALLHAYIHWGERCLDHLDGMFAFAIWDTKEQTLFAARDRFGVKPLYLCEEDGEIALASEVRALTRWRSRRPRFDARGLEGYLAFGIGGGVDTLLEGIRSLPAGYHLRFRAGVTTMASYYAPPLGPQLLMERDEVIGTLRELLHSAVRLRLVADVPVAVFTSGGLDSCAVLALASMNSDRPLTAFTFASRDLGWNEAPLARSVAAMYGCRHEVCDVSAHDIESLVTKGLAALDLPSADGLNSFIISDAVRSAGFKVALSGVGGDELFAGYGHVRRARRLFPMISALTRWLGPGMSAQPMPGHHRMSPRLRRAAAMGAAGNDLIRYYASQRALMTDADRRAYALPHKISAASFVDASAIEDQWAVGGVDVVQAITALELSFYLRDVLLHDIDVMSMARSVEVREPLVDRRLVEFCLRIPSAMKLDGTPKALFAAAAPPLPTSVAGKRHGFTLPFERWLVGSLKPWAQSTLASGPPGLRLFWDEFLRDPSPAAASRVWPLLVLLDWARRHDVEWPDD